MQDGLIRWSCLLWVVAVGGAACGGPSKEVTAALDDAANLEKTFTLSLASGSNAGLRKNLTAAFPEVSELISGGEAARTRMLAHFQGTPGFEKDLQLAIYAYALEQMGDQASVAALRGFLDGNLNGELVVAPHFAMQALEVLTHRKVDPFGYYARVDMRNQAEGNPSKQSLAPGQKASCGRRYVLVDASGNPLTYKDASGKEKTAYLEGNEHASPEVPPTVRANYLEAVSDGGGTYVKDDPAWAGEPSKQFNCAGYAFRQLNGGRLWTADPSRFYEVLTRTGQLVEVPNESDAQPGDKIFYFQKGDALPGHVAEVHKVETFLTTTVTVRNADGQSGLWDAPSNASYFTGKFLRQTAKFPTRKVFRWKSGIPSIIPDPTVADNDDYCGKKSSGSDGTLSATVDIPGFTIPFAPISVRSTNRGEYSGNVEVGDAVGILASEEVPLGPLSELLTLAIDARQVTGPGTLDVGENDLVFDTQQFEATGFFTTPLIRDNDDVKGMVVFEALSGTVTLTDYDEAVGGRVAGTFSITVRGEQTTGKDLNDEWIEVEHTGTITGSFDVTISNEPFTP